MYIKVSNLIDNDKISYDDLQSMLDTKLINNMFIKQNDGIFIKVDRMKIKKIGEGLLENILKDFKENIDFAKNDFHRLLIEYKNEYKELQRIYYNLPKDEKTEICKKQFKEFMKRDEYNYQIKLNCLHKAKRKHAEQFFKYNDKNNIIYKVLYNSIFLYEIEYKKAVEKYVNMICKENENNL